MKFIALDPSLRGFGWSVCQCDPDGSNVELMDYGVWKTGAKTLYVLRYTYLRQQLRDLLRRHPDVLMVGMEIPPLNESYSAGLYALHVVIMEAVIEHRKRVVHFNPSTVKSLAAETLAYKGKIDKTEIVKAARILFPTLADQKRLNHNAADALIMLHMTRRFYLFQTGFLKPEDLTPKENESYYGWRPRLKEIQGLISKEDDQWYAFDEAKYDLVLGSQPHTNSGIMSGDSSSPTPDTHDDEQEEDEHGI